MKNASPSATLRTALVLGLAASSAAAQSLLGQYGQAVLGAGDPAPGLAGVTIYNTNSTAFDTPVLDQNGVVVFRARLAGAVSALDDRAIFVGHANGDLSLAVRAGDQAPGLPAGIFLRSNTSGASGPNSNVQISPFNEFLYFSSSLSDNGATVTTANDSALFWGPVGGLALLAREGDQVPFLPTGVLWGSLSSFSRQFNKINSGGQVVLICTLTGSVTAADDVIIATGSPSSLQQVVREGQDIDGLGGTVAGSVTSLSFSEAINDAGDILLDMSLAGTATAANNSVLAVWRAATGVSILAREGDPAPGMAPGVVLTGAPGRGGNSWNNSGNTAFTWFVDDGGVTITAANDQVVFYGGTSGVVKVLQEGDPTGFAGGETFGTVNNSSLTSNEAGTIAFFCGLTDSMGGALPTTDDSAMVIGTAGSWTEIVREGQPIAAIPPSVNGPWVCNSVNSAPNLNNRGQLLFSQAASDGVDTNTFILCWDPTLGLLIVKDGTETYATTVGAGTATGIPSSAGPQSGGDGSPMWFTNAGDLVIRESVDSGLVTAIVRGHVGQLQAVPASVSVATGGSQNWSVDVGPGFGAQLYVILGTASGTRPGAMTPLGPQTIPLNFDAWTDLSLALANTVVYTNSLGFTDAQGQAAASFNLPPATGLGTFLLHHAAITLDLTLMQTFVSEPVALKLY